MLNSEQTFAGIDIGGTNVKFGLFDHKGKVLHKEQRPTMADKGADALLHMIANIAERLMLFAAEEELDVRHLGVGTPGAVNFETGQVIGPSPNIKGWQGVQIGQTLKDRLNMPVFVDNDVNCMAQAEAMFGAASSGKVVVCITLGTGVGGAVLFDGRLYRGTNYSAGEIGHIPVEANGIECNCGNRGCLESYVSSKALIARAKFLISKNMNDEANKILEGDIENLNIRKLFALFKAGDEYAHDALEYAAGYVGAALSGVVNLLNPDCVVIGGGIAEGDSGLIGMIESEIKRRAFDSATSQLSVLRASLGNDAGFIGAGILGENVG